MKRWLIVFWVFASVAGRVRPCVGGPRPGSSRPRTDEFFVKLLGRLPEKTCETSQIEHGAVQFASSKSGDRSRAKADANAFLVSMGPNETFLYCAGAGYQTTRKRLITADATNYRDRKAPFSCELYPLAGGRIFEAGTCHLASLRDLSEDSRKILVQSVIESGRIAGLDEAESIQKAIGTVDGVLLADAIAQVYGACGLACVDAAFVSQLPPGLRSIISPERDRLAASSLRVLTSDETGPLQRLQLPALDSNQRYWLRLSPKDWVVSTDAVRRGVSEWHTVLDGERVPVEATGSAPRSDTVDKSHPEVRERDNDRADPSARSQLDLLTAQTKVLKGLLDTAQSTRETPVLWLIEIGVMLTGIGVITLGFLVGFTALRRLAQERVLSGTQLTQDLFLAVSERFGSESIRVREGAFLLLLERIASLDRENRRTGSRHAGGTSLTSLVRLLIATANTEPTERLRQYAFDELVRSIGATISGDRSLDSTGPLTGYDFRGVNLDNVNWEGVDARGVDFTGATFRGAILTRATFRDGCLRSTVLEGVDLRDADLSGVDLRSANLVAANLRNANLSRADLRGAQLLDLDLETARRFDARIGPLE